MAPRRVFRQIYPVYCSEPASAYHVCKAAQHSLGPRAIRGERLRKSKNRAASHDRCPWRYDRQGLGRYFANTRTRIPRRRSSPVTAQRWSSTRRQSAATPHSKVQRSGTPSESRALTSGRSCCDRALPRCSWDEFRLGLVEVPLAARRWFAPLA